MNKYLYIFFFLFIMTVYISCCKESKINAFTYSYTIENKTNFKIEFQINPDTTYSIKKYNYFFDNFEQKKRLIEHSGTLEKRTFEHLIRLVNESNIGKMAHSYGFNDISPSDDIITYTVILSYQQTIEFVTININSSSVHLPKSFLKLVKFTNDLQQNLLTEP